jgi:hypothetical protein
LPFVFRESTFRGFYFTYIPFWDEIFGALSGQSINGILHHFGIDGQIVFSA